MTSVDQTARSRPRQTRPPCCPNLTVLRADCSPTRAQGGLGPSQWCKPKHDHFPHIKRLSWPGLERSKGHVGALCGKGGLAHIQGCKPKQANLPTSTFFRGLHLRSVAMSMLVMHNLRLIDACYQNNPPSLQSEYVHFWW